MQAVRKMTNTDHMKKIKIKIKKRKTKIKNFTLFDDTVFDILSLLNNLDSNFNQIANKLSPGVTANFFKIANKEYYGREVPTIGYPMRLLSYKAMKQTLIISILMDHFERCLDFKYFSFDKFQKQAYFCAVVSKALGEMLGYSKPEDLYTVGILNNIGELVIAAYFKEEHRKIIALKESEDISVSEAERSIFGVDHAEIGALVLERFNIPRDMCDAVRYHHATNPIIVKDFDFRLALITRESAMIADSFELPEMEPHEISNRLKGVIREGQKICMELLSMEMRSNGYRKVFPDLLQRASKLVYKNLNGLNERVSLEDGHEILTLNENSFQAAMVL